MAALGRPGGLSPSGSSELRLRTLSSLVLGALALGTAWLGGVLLAAFWLSAAIAVFVEWVGMACSRRQRALKAMGSAGLALLVAAQLTTGTSWLVLALLLAGFVVLVIGTGLRERAWALAGFVYAAAIALVPIALRPLPEIGLVALLWMFAVVWSTDVAGYFGGRLIGGPKLWPSVSPNKTWSGFACGLLGGALAGCAVGAAAAAAGARLPLGLAAVAALSAAASVASQGGDLIESAMKRRFGVKDSGQLIPGHGGAMDRLDGFAALALFVGLALVGGAIAGRCCAP